MEYPGGGSFYLSRHFKLMTNEPWAWDLKARTTWKVWGGQGPKHERNCDSVLSTVIMNTGIALFQVLNSKSQISVGVTCHEVPLPLSLCAFIQPSYHSPQLSLESAAVIVSVSTHLQWSHGQSVDVENLFPPSSTINKCSQGNRWRIFLSFFPSLSFFFSVTVLIFEF